MALGKIYLGNTILMDGAAIAAAIGSEATNALTFSDLVNFITSDKQTLATNLTNKTVSASANETLSSLVAKVAQVPSNDPAPIIAAIGSELASGSTVEQIAEAIVYDKELLVSFLNLYGLTGQVPTTTLRTLINQLGNINATRYYQVSDNTSNVSFINNMAVITDTPDLVIQDPLAPLPVDDTSDVSFMDYISGLTDQPTLTLENIKTALMTSNTVAFLQSSDLVNSSTAGQVTFLTPPLSLNMTGTSITTPDNYVYASNTCGELPRMFMSPSDGYPRSQWGSCYPSTPGFINTSINTGRSKSVNAQDTQPRYAMLSPDGLTMFVLGGTNKTVYQYTLSTAWAVDTATYASKSFNTSTQNTTPDGLTFSADGLTMFTLDVGITNKTVHQYTLSTAWDVSTASYANKSFIVSTQAASPSGMDFSTDGTIMYVCSQGNKTVYQYTLSTAWDVSTASYANKSYYANAQDTQPKDVRFSSDGTKMYVYGYTSKTIYQYNLGTAWDISTASYASKALSTTGYDSAVYGIYITGNDKILYIMGSTNKTVYQLTMDPEITGVQFTVNFPSAVTLNAYDMTCYADSNIYGRYLTSWQLYTSTDGGSNWTLSDTRSSQFTSATNNTTNYYLLASPLTNVNAIKLIGVANRNNDNSYTSIGHMNFYKYLAATSSGTPSASSIYNTSYDAWKAFNGTNSDANDCWITVNGTVTGWLKYQFNTPQVVKQYCVAARNNTLADAQQSYPRNWTFEGSNDNTNWTVLDTKTNQSVSAIAQSNAYNIANTDAYTYYRINITSNNGNASYTAIGELVLVNINNGVGICSASTIINSTYDAYKAFNRTVADANDCWMTANNTLIGWLKYQFPVATAINRYVLVPRNNADLSNFPKNWTFEGSNDNTNWDILDTRINQSLSGYSFDNAKVYDIANTTGYIYYRINITANNGSTTVTTIGDFRLSII